MRVRRPQDASDNFRPLRHHAVTHRQGLRLNETTTRRSRRAAVATVPPTPAVEADPLLQLLAAMQDVEAGDFSVRLPLHWDGVPGKLATVFNEIVSHNRRLAEELARVGQKVG